MIGKNGIIDKIDTAIKNKWSKECIDILEKLAPKQDDAADKAFIRYYSSQKLDTVDLQKIKEKIRELEEVNSQLCYLVHFLVENLPELIIKNAKGGQMNNVNPSDASVEFSSHKLIVQGEQPAIPTKREKDILELLEKGYCAKEIATRLYISETTVITHKKNLKKKYNVKNTVELIAKFKEVG